MAVKASPESIRAMKKDISNTIRDIERISNGIKSGMSATAHWDDAQAAQFNMLIVTVLISLSPVGEWTLAALAGAKEIKRKDIKIRLIPLLEIVFEQAKERTPSMINSIRLKIIHDQSPNAFAMGRRTICVTDGLLNLSDEEIMAVFAHEVGHLAYQHSAIQLLIGGGNLFITGCLFILKVICWVITALCGLVTGLVSRNLFATVCC